MNFDEVNQEILRFSSVKVSAPFGESKQVYSLNDQAFAMVDKDKLPVRLSLRCDPQLSELLREKYDEVMPGDHLDEKNWNTIVLTGQLGAEEIKDLIRHSYLLAESGSVSQANDK